MCERAGLGKGSEVLSNAHVGVFRESWIFVSFLHNYFCNMATLFMHLMCDPKKMLYEANHCDYE